VTITKISVHLTETTNEVAIVAINVPNILGQTDWYAPSSLPGTNYYLRFEVVDSCSFTNSRIFFDNPFTIVPEPGLFVPALAGLLGFAIYYFRRNAA